MSILNAREYRRQLLSLETNRDDIADFFRFVVRRIWETGDPTSANQLIEALEKKNSRYKQKIVKALLQVIPFHLGVDNRFHKKDKKRERILEKEWTELLVKLWYEIPINYEPKQNKKPKRKKKYDYDHEQAKKEFEWKRRRLPGSGFSNLRKV